MSINQCRRRAHKSPEQTRRRALTGTSKRYLVFPGHRRSSFLSWSVLPGGRTFRDEDKSWAFKSPTCPSPEDPRPFLSVPLFHRIVVVSFDGAPFSLLHRQPRSAWRRCSSFPAHSLLVLLRGRRRRRRRRLLPRPPRPPAA